MRYSLGLHIEGEHLKVALIHKCKNKIEIDLLRSFSLTDLENVKPLYTLSTILSGKKTTITSGLDAYDILFREIQIKLASKRAVLSVLPFQAETLLPHPLEEIILIPSLYKRGDGSTDVALFTTTHVSLKDHLSKLNNLEINPEIVSCTPNALCRLSEFLLPSSKSPKPLFSWQKKKENPEEMHTSTLFFDIGQETISYGLLSEGRVKISLSLKRGMQDLIAALAQDNPQEELAKVDFCNIDSSLFPHLHEICQQLKKDLARIFVYIKEKTDDNASFPILLTGDISALMNFQEFFSSSIGISHHLLPIPQDLQNFSLPLGLALDGLHQDSQTVQFRQGPYTHPSLLKKRTQQAAIYASSCFILAVSIWAAGTLFVSKKTDVIFQQLMSYTAQELSPSKGTLEQEISKWEVNLSKEKGKFPFIPTVPKVSDVLAWISTHPRLSGVENKKEMIEVQKMRYSLIKYPKMNQKLEAYQAKVELEFTAASPRLAREFHEALLAGDFMVDPKQGVTWNMRQNAYVTSFFLKEQTR